MFFKYSSRDTVPLQKAAYYLSELGLRVDKAADMLPGDGLAQLLVAGQHYGEGEAGQPPQREQGRQLQALHTNRQEFSPLCQHYGEGEAGQPPQWEQGRQLQALHTNRQEFSPLCERGRAATTVGTEAPAAGPAHK